MPKNPSFRIVSFMTKNTVYEKVLKEYLGSTVGDLKVPYIFYAMNNEGSWIKNVAMKPRVILQALEQFPENIVFLDADSKIECFPTLFNEIPPEFDLAAHYLDWNAWYGYTEKSPRKELLSGTMFFRNTEKVKKLVKKWAADASAHTIWEQKLLQNILQREKTAYRVYDLPLSYCYIRTLPNGSEPKVKVDKIVISHYQVSRTLRKLITSV